MVAADLNADGRDEIIVVNLRNARLDLYAWQTGSDTDDDRDGVDGHVNDLPMAAELTLTEVAVRQPPIDVAAQPWGDGEAMQLFVLVSNPNKLLRFEFSDENDKWVSKQSWDLLPGRYAGGGHLLKFVRPADSDTVTVLVSCFEGIQQLTLKPTADGDANRRARARWLEPRETVNRNDWWLADLDGDGREDLLEWTSDTSQSLRWYPGSGHTADESHGFRPAQTLHDRGVSDVALLDQPAGTPDELLVLENQPEGAVRRYHLAEGELSDLGKREPLALAGGDNAVWTTAVIEGRPTLIATDPDQPRVTLYTYDDTGWQAGESFPVIGKVEAMATRRGDPAEVMLWADGGADLFVSTWRDGRLSFPEPMGWADDLDEGLILGMGTVGEALWCVQKADEDLRLMLWESAADGLEIHVFPNAAGKAEQAHWLGDAGLLVVDKFAKGLRVVRPGEDGGDAVNTEPSQLAKARLEEFRLLDTAEGNRVVGRFTDGVMQWLDDDLVATDQVMLPDGQPLADLVLNADGSAWALQQGGRAIHRLVPDDAGVLRVESTTRVEGGRSLVDDPTLGLLMVTGQGVTRLSEGQPRELDVAQSLDARTGRPDGVRDATVHRVMSLDLDGDGRDDALLADDLRHQLTALGQADDTGELLPMISWPVFEDQSYPYGGQGEELIREPRRIIALDLDGDGGRDLAMFCHDRLLIYLANDKQSETNAEETPEENEHD